MKSINAHLLAFSSLLLGERAVAHQVHGIFLVNGTESLPWYYVRDVAPQFYYPPGTWSEGNDYPKVSPQMDIHSSNITCGRLAFESAATTHTADVLAGSEVGFRVSWDGKGRYGVFWHPGPAHIYLSRAPNDDLANYQGDGDWFKIAFAGPISNNAWQIWGGHDFNFTIPKTTPPGKYLVRIESYMPTIQFDYSQWYINCAHVNIIGPGGGTPRGFARFPGTYSIYDPGLWIPKDQFVNGGYVEDADMKLLDYRAPGPAIWTG
jgi:hypothetical protein